MTLDDGSVTAPAQVQVESQEPGRVVLRMTIYEGKNRQIRRMCEAVSLEVGAPAPGFHRADQARNGAARQVA